ncbi:Os05g0261700 [Oryza sativa Japonica Group]|uniref:Os05g0261700 protein n=2 Tax=Oryza sativa subsp. japonica TaxID=39947 RepID=Q60DQ8_ORYSJ|nr:unknown protein [Oryza sativa Japonica Group]KAB8098705.1 hypothetical protein EE612_028206 [Oryza sativa]BAS93059.1 Os05g0261700 [Oryza sativa Japonica Group]
MSGRRTRFAVGELPPPPPAAFWKVEKTRARGRKRRELLLHGAHGADELAVHAVAEPRGQVEREQCGVQAARRAERRQEGGVGGVAQRPSEARKGGGSGARRGSCSRSRRRRRKADRLGRAPLPYLPPS